MIELPKIPSKLLHIAVDDMKKTLSQGHIIDMGNWGENIDTYRCSVCMAGAVMLQTTKVKPDYMGRYYNNVNHGINFNCYQALDSIREGNLYEFLNHLGYKSAYESKTFEQVNKYLASKPTSQIQGWNEWHKCEPEDFFEQIEDLIEHLESLNM